VRHTRHIQYGDTCAHRGPTAQLYNYQDSPSSSAVKNIGRNRSISSPEVDGSPHQYGNPSRRLVISSSDDLCYNRTRNIDFAKTTSETLTLCYYKIFALLNAFSQLNTCIWT
jgi:hypothetical protein